MKTHLIIFSKNRPMQLECLLRSVKFNLDIFDKVTVQFSSEPPYTSGYKQLEKEYGKKLSAIFVNEDNFSGFEEAFKVIFSQSYEKTCFMVDDDIVFRKPRKIVWDSDIYSLRLGRNIKNKVHFDYTASVDGNIFTTSQIESILDHSYKNPNKFENAMIRVTDGLSMYYDFAPCLVGIPANKVSDTSGCDDMDVSTLELMDKFKKGYRIDYENMDLICNNVHCYVGYKFKRL